MKDEDVLGDLEFSTISEEEATWLDMLFPKDEVLFIVFQGFDGDKAPRLDGFSMVIFFFFFFQTCLHILKLDIMDLFQNFLAQAVFEKSLNATFLALIPKKLKLWK